MHTKNQYFFPFTEYGPLRSVCLPEFVCSRYSEELPALVVLLIALETISLEHFVDARS